MNPVGAQVPNPPLPTRGEDAANAAGEGTGVGARRAPSPSIPKRRALTAKAGTYWQAPRPDRESGNLPPSWRTRAAAGALVLFALAQILIPLRHWAYPGNVRWNEDGYRFSWRVLLTEKHGHVRFRVRDPATGEERVVQGTAVGGATRPVSLVPQAATSFSRKREPTPQPRIIPAPQ